MDQPLVEKRILIFVGEMYEDLELWYPKLRLIEAGAKVVLAAALCCKRYRSDSEPIPRFNRL